MKYEKSSSKNSNVDRKQLIEFIFIMHEFHL